MSGQVDRAIETGKMLLARLGGRCRRGGGPAPGDRPGRDRRRPLGEAAASVRSPASPRRRRRPDGRMRGAGRGGPGAWPRRTGWPRPRWARPSAGRPARGGLRGARGDRPGRRQRDLDVAERLFAREAEVAGAHGLQLWRLRGGRARHHRPAPHREHDRLEQARELAVAQGALALTATLDLQIAAGLNKQFRPVRRCRPHTVDRASRRFHLATLPMALIFQATAHAIRGEQGHGGQDRRGDRARPRRPGRDRLLLGTLPGHVLLLAEDLGEAHAQMATGAGLILSSPATIAPPFLGLWPLLGAAARPGRGGPRPGSGPPTAPGTWWSAPCSVTPTPSSRAGGPAREAEAAFAAADAQMGPLVAWYRHYARRRPPRPRWPTAGGAGGWLREAAGYFAARGDDRVAAACRGSAAPGRGAGPAAPALATETAGSAARPRRDRTRGRCAAAGRPGPGQPGNRRDVVPVAAHRGEARGEPACQDRPAPLSASWVFRRPRWVAAALN